MIDLRSDTVTQPPAAMRQAMASAVVGDDVFGEDPTVNRLQAAVAELLGKEDALFTPSGVMANQIAIRCLTEPGDEVIVERNSHILNYETAAPSLISSVQLLPVDGVRGVYDRGRLREAIRPNVYYLPRTSLVCVENTHNMAGGAVIPYEAMVEIHDLARNRGMKVHLDGARIWNAWIASGVHPRAYAALADTVSVCFSKGLGAPAGSMVAGTRDTIGKARKVRKILGGGMRQAGVLAAAALYALEHNVDRLREDHEHARFFAERISRGAGKSLRCEPVETNIVIMDVGPSGRNAADVIAALKEKGVLAIASGPSTIRFVTHLDVDRGNVERAADTVIQVLS